MNTMHFSVNTLRWAASNIGMRLEDVFAQISQSDKSHERFLNGELSINQAQTLAKITHVPFGYLFLDQPPAIDRPQMPDLRQTNNPDPLTDDFYDTLKDVRSKQEWFIDFLRDQDFEPVNFVGQFTLEYASKNHKEVADHIKQTLGLNSKSYAECRDADKYYNLLVNHCEQNGILVFRNSIVKSNTHRALSPSEFRGFVITDKYAPAIFINGKDSQSAWIFTLAHELAHVWLNIEGVIGDTIGRPNDPVELTCNKIAAELLVPESCFLGNWERTNNISELAKMYKVSRLVIAKRAFDFGLIDYETYSVHFKLAYQNTSKKDSSPSPYVIYPIRNSKLITKHISNQAARGILPLREAARMLNVSPKTVLELARRMESA